MDIPTGAVVVDDYGRRGLALIGGGEPLVWWFPADAEIAPYDGPVPLNVITDSTD